MLGSILLGVLQVVVGLQSVYTVLHYRRVPWHTMPQLPERTAAGMGEHIARGRRLPPSLNAAFPQGVPGNVAGAQVVAAARGIVAANEAIAFQSFIPERVEFLGKVYHPRTYGAAALSAYVAAALPKTRVRPQGGDAVDVNEVSHLRANDTVIFVHVPSYELRAAVLTLLSPKRGAVTAEQVQQISERSHEMAQPLRSLERAFKAAYLEALNAAPAQPASQGQMHPYDAAAARHAAAVSARAQAVRAAIAAKDAAVQDLLAAVAARDAELMVLAPGQALPRLELPDVWADEILRLCQQEGATTAFECYAGPRAASCRPSGCRQNVSQTACVRAGGRLSPACSKSRPPLLELSSPVRGICSSNERTSHGAEP